MKNTAEATSNKTSKGNLLFGCTRLLNFEPGEQRANLLPHFSAKNYMLVHMTLSSQHGLDILIMPPTLAAYLSLLPTLTTRALLLPEQR